MGSGRLYIIATPIGNQDDWSSRAISIVSGLDILAAEDTRKTGVLLSKYNIKVKTVSIHEHNESEKAQYILSLLQDGKNVGLVSDAGTPLISDPGFRVVRLAQEQGVNVSPIPGPCAAIAALSVSGIPTDRFCFEGFLPSKESERIAKLNILKEESRTLVFYESPNRIIKSLSNMLDVFGAKRKVTFLRELTKSYETIKAGSLQEILNFVSADKEQELGEIVIVVEGINKRKEDSSLSSLEKNIVDILVKKFTVKDAVDVVRQISKAKKQDIYNYALTVKE